VMVDDNHIDAQSLRQKDLSVRVNSVVDRDQKIGAAQREFVNRTGTETISLVSVGQIRSRLNS
jgi:hypothetical protein